MLSIELFNLTLLYSFLGCFFEYSPLLIPYRFSVYNLQGLRVSRRFGLVPSLIHQYKVPITSGNSVGWLKGLTNHAGRLLLG